jgi:hypothetical protein
VRSRFSSELVEETPCCPKEVVLSVTTVGAPGNPPRLLRLSERIENIIELIPVVDDRVLVAGSMRYGGEAIIVANLREAVQEQGIWTYGWAVSPSRRFLVYRTHYPRMMPPEGRRSILLLWDLSKPPAENMKGEAREFPTPNLGRVLFPEVNVERGSFDVSLAPDWGLNSPFLWSKDSRRLVFLASYWLDPRREARECSIVRIDLSPDGGVESIERALLRPDRITFRGRPRYDRLAPNESVCFYTEKLKWDEGEPVRVVAGLDPLAASELGSTLVIDVP